MITETSDKVELFAAMEETFAQLVAFLIPLNQEQINTIPYEDSWTPAQLFQHILKSNRSVLNAMRSETKTVERDPTEYVQKLKTIFLDFSTRIKSPDFIVPEEQTYQKQAIIDALKDSVTQIKESADNTNLREIVENHPLGPISKLEMLHFVIYHTQRHLHQLSNMIQPLMDQ